MDWIRYNTRVHDEIGKSFDLRHDEIFNSMEQERLRREIEVAASLVRADSEPRLALDYGAGTGNVTRHLLDMGFRTTSADVSRELLSIIRDRYSDSGMCDTIVVNGEDLSGLPDGSFHMAVAYSVLHHVPDYPRAVAEMIRVLKPGGVIYLDHESCPGFWNQSPEYRAFLRRVWPPWKIALKLLSPKWYRRRLRALIMPGCFEEGDIHVWPHDHVEWDRIEEVALSAGCEILLREDYLLYKPSYPMDVYRAYAGVCGDTRLFVARRAR